MDEKRAKELLEKTFKNSFDIEQFSKFIKELFNEFTVSNTKLGVDDDYKGYIDSCQRIGSYKNNKDKIDVLAVKLKDSPYKDRARTKQRNIIADYLEIEKKDAALVAFYGDDLENWRFSFVKLDYQLSSDGKVIKELTSAKRYSYLAGVNEPSHTCQKRFLELVKEEKKLPTLFELEEAFSVEKVTKEFFLEYEKLFLNLRDSLDKIIEKSPDIKKEFEAKNISSADFSKKSLGQIVFLYFLQKKGWLGVETGKEWGSGHKDFLKKLFDKEIVGYSNFFNDILEPLFYEALAMQHEDDYYSKFDCKIPFLNGGLFEPMNSYKWFNLKIPLENSIFENIFKVFDRYNFTVKEDEPLDKEVAIDPEMLGKVFESLLGNDERKSKGAFYTPREIVHYMCQQSLINYIHTNSGIELKDIENFIYNGESEKLKDNSIKIDELLKNIKIIDSAVGSGAFPMGMMNEIVKARYVLSLNFKDVKNVYDLKRETIENCIYGVDIDPSAVEISKLRFWLSLIVDETDRNNIKPLPNLEYKIMCGNSLLETFEGIKLFDDSLLIEEKDTSEIDNDIESLYLKVGNIIKGKSKEDINEVKKEIKKLEKEKEKLVLKSDDNKKNLTLGEVGKQKIKESKKKLNELKELHKKIFKEHDRELKKKYIAESDKLEWGFIEETLKESGHEDAIKKLENYKKNMAKPFFLWKLYFSEVFQRENGGFDVVIGNPPYVQIQKFSGKQEQKDWENEKYKTYNKTGDIYCLFYEKGNLLLRENGVLSFITSNKWMRANYGKSLREYFVKSVNPLIMVDFGGYKVFDNATVDTCILTLKKENYLKNTVACSVKSDFDKNSKIENYVSTNSIILNKLSEDSWIIVNNDETKIKEKIERIGTPLKDWDISINYGIKTGLNEAFIIDGKKKDELIAKDPKNAEIIKPILRGRDIKKYKAEFADLWLIATFPSLKVNIEYYPAIRDYLKTFGKKLEQSGEKGCRKKTAHKWFEIQDNIAYYKDFEKEKIVWGSVSETYYSFVEKDIFLLDTNYFCVFNNKYINKYILSLLNSKLIIYFINQKDTRVGSIAYRHYKYNFQQIPIPKLSPEAQKPFIALVETILAKKEKGEDTTDQEKEIDQLVYKLYELTPEEISIIENFNK